MIKIITIKDTTCVLDDNDDNFIALCYTQDKTDSKYRY